MSSDALKPRQEPQAAPVSREAAVADLVKTKVLVELSLEKMKKLGWEPKVSPEEAIRRTAKWTLANS